MSFPLPLRIAQKLPVRNSWELIIKKLPIPLPIFYYFELSREVLANTGYVRQNLVLEYVLKLRTSKVTFDLGFIIQYFYRVGQSW